MITKNKQVTSLDSDLLKSESQHLRETSRQLVTTSSYLLHESQQYRNELHRLLRKAERHISRKTR